MIYCQPPVGAAINRAGRGGSAGHDGSAGREGSSGANHPQRRRAARPGEAKRVWNTYQQNLNGYENFEYSNKMAKCTFNFYTSC